MEKRLEEIFGRLYENLLEINSASEQEYANFTAMEGHRYRGAKNASGSPFRLMLVGRAVNGWDEYRGGKPLTRESFIDASMKNIKNAPGTVSQGSRYKDRFEWIDTQGNSVKNAKRIGIDPPDFDDDYLLTESPFWSYAKDVWCKAYGRTQAWDKRWFENIVWTNLYKIAPHGKGNPDRMAKAMQESVCVELLKAEIEYFDPTHILFVTAQDWFAPFEGLFEDVHLRKPNRPRGVNKNNFFAEGTATYLTEKGTRCKVIIACRPEMRIKGDYVKQVSDFLMGKESIAE